MIRPGCVPSLNCLCANVVSMIAPRQWSAPGRLTPATSLPSLLVRSSGRRSLMVRPVTSGSSEKRGWCFWCFSPLKTGRSYPSVLRCRSHVLRSWRILEEHQTFPFFSPTEILFSRSMLLTLLGSLGLIFFFLIVIEEFTDAHNSVSVSSLRIKLGFS